MKITLLFLTVLGLLTLTNCTPKTDVNQLLSNTETKDEIFKAIANDHAYMMDFMEQMEGNDHAMQMLQGNQKMMGTMMQGKGLQRMMNDSTMMKNMTQQMMKHGAMKHAMMQQMMTDSMSMEGMMQMMHQKGMMSNECMQSCMKMMKDKGMMHSGMMNPK